MNNIRKYAGLLACFSTFGMTQSLQSDLLDCAQINDSLQRLVCYDNLAKKAQLKTVNKPNKHSNKPEVAVSPSLPAQQKKVVLPTQLVAELPIASDTSKAKPLVSAAENFGQENKKSPKDLINQIQGKIVKVTKSAYGEQIITLDNGQVWRQTDSVRLKLVEGQSVTIKRGALGSFFISKENANKRIRAKRVS
jgi:hypothetical protein